MKFPGKRKSKHYFPLILLTASLKENFPVLHRDLFQRFQTVGGEARTEVSVLGLPPERVMMTFQSRFGREPWLTPYTDETLKMLGEKGTQHVQVICPGFSADCLETAPAAARALKPARESLPGSAAGNHRPHGRSVAEYKNAWREGHTARTGYLSGLLRRLSGNAGRDRGAEE
jgi:hypothetical protein